MSKPSHFSGAPASTAGDAFHETWALREALKLLNFKSPLIAMTVEGVRDAPDTDDKANWDGVDCALYFDEEQMPEQSRIELIQLKYSVASPAKRWTPTRFCRSTRKTGSNSVARRLADAFQASCKRKPFRWIRKTVSVRLVSNQPISKTLTTQIEKGANGTLRGKAYKTLKAATGLSKPMFKLFCEQLELRGGEAARADLKAEVVTAVWNLIHHPSDGVVDSLLMKIRERMHPHGLKCIDRTTVLSWFSIGDGAGLFPCETSLAPPCPVINRGVTSTLSQAIESHPLVCFHGGGGCGKTTVARALESVLPEGSRVILYDCYGGGAYRDRSQARHRPHEAFKQLANELARATNAPLFFPYGNAPDMARAFRAKFIVAAELLRLSDPGGLLVVLVDAADNALHAAYRLSPPDPCFVRDLVSFEDLPDNVRIVISCRSSRVPELELPVRAHSVRCEPFSLPETTELLKLTNHSGAADLVEDFHNLTFGNPRVQANTIKQTESLTEAVEFLRPNGQSLNTLFEVILDEQCTRAGVDTPHATLCAALSVLPTPVPVSYLADVCTRISILALARSQDTPPLRRIPRLFALNPAHHLRR